MGEQFTWLPEEDSHIQAYVMSDGQIIDETTFEKARKATNPNDKTNLMTTEQDEFGESYSSGRVWRPPMIFKNLKLFSVENPWHATSIRRITEDVCRDWDIVPVDIKGVSISTEGTKLTRNDKLLYDFFDSCNSDFIEMCKSIAIDYQTFAFGTIEVLRTRIGKISKLNHAQSETFRIARHMSDNLLTDGKFMVQVVNAHERIFKVYDDQGPCRYREPRTGNPMSEISYITNYDVNGGHYGMPYWLPSLKSMLGYNMVAEYNINFFNNEAVPRFAVVCQGGKLDDETKTRIQSYFKKDLKGLANAHKTLVLSSPKGVEIKLIPLAVDIKDGSFRFYRKDNRDEILAAHGLPAHRANVLDSGSSGSLSPGTVFALDKVYKYTIVEPLQKKIASIFNNIIKYEFNITDRIFQFTPLDIGEDKEKSDNMRLIAGAHEKYYATGILTPDDIRKELRYEPYATMKNVSQDVVDWATTPRPVYLIRQAQMQQTGDGINANPNGENLNQTPNANDEKSKEQTGNTLFNDQQINQMMMSDTNKVLKVLNDLGNELRESLKITLDIEKRE